MSMLLEKTWVVNSEAERFYVYAPGEVCVDLTSGAPGDRARVLALLVQARRMALVLSDLLPALEGRSPLGDRYLDARGVLRDAGVLDE